MNVVARNVEPSAAFAGLTVCDTQDGLTAFLEADCAAALWQRGVPTPVSTWLGGLDVDALPRGRSIVPLADIRAAAAQLCDEVSLAAGPHRDWLINDIGVLADHFGALMGARFLRLRLDAVSTNACRRFHIDAITARLVCTYRGTGTQVGVGVGGADPAQIATIPTGSPILLRGSRWPADPAPGLLHRSPPIEGTGETRLVLVLDPVTDPDEES